MKKLRKIAIGISMLVCFILLPTIYHFTKARYSGGYYPVFMKRSELENSIAWMPVHELKNPGKIYVKDNFIFINEKYKGIHVIDNTDTKSPVNLGFIRIPGNIDIAVKNNTLYVDNAVDLVAIDFSNFSTLKETSRQKNAFPELASPDGYSGSSYSDRPDNAIIVEWRKIE